MWPCVLRSQNEKTTAAIANMTSMTADGRAPEPLVWPRVFEIFP